MNAPKYLYKSEESLHIFEFLSEGPKGKIQKVVQYSETSTTGVYNLAFGDFDKESQSINDLSITNNGDSQKVLATVASTVYAFLDKYPEAMVFATGSTLARTRLYRMGISNNLSDISKDFDVYGLTETGNQWERFVVGTVYEAFLVSRKENSQNDENN